MRMLRLPGDTEIPLILRKSARARRISLRVSQLDGRVTLTVPHGVSEHEAIAFAREKEAWLRKHLAARIVAVDAGLGAIIPIGGRLHEVARGTGRRVRFEADCVRVPGPSDRVAKRLGAHLKTLARTRLAEASDRYAAKLDTAYTAITLRDTRSRWGSCTSEKRLMFSWRLILAPPDVLDYVAAHEVAHLRHMNHSHAFWAEVERLYGDYRDARSWLRREGTDLHRYRFGA
ncbi:MAG: SprT family zinc-dependent metalloprotease [Pseudomonadota bacterium]